MNIEGLGIVGTALYALIAITGGIASAWYVWNHAPQVGGEFWPYIQAIASIVAFVIGAKLIALVGAVVVLVILGLVGILITIFD